MAKDLKKVVTQLKGAVVAHGKQAKTIEKHIKDMNDGPSFLNKLKEKVGAKVQEKLGQVFSNGTGDARPNFEESTQNDISSVMSGQRKMLQFGRGANEKLKENSQKLSEVLKAVQSNNPGNNPQSDFTKMASQQTASMPLADPMTTTPGSIPEGSNDDAVNAANSAIMNMDMGAMMAAKPKQVAKAKAKAYADKKGIRGKARKELVKDAKRSQSFDDKAQDEKSGDKAVEFGGSMHIDPPKAKTMKRDGTKVFSNQTKFPSYFKNLSQSMIAEGAAEGIANAGKMAYSKKMEKLKPAKNFKNKN